MTARLPLPRVSGPVVGLLTMLGLFVLLLWWRGEVGRFFSADNLQLLMHDSSYRGVAALGMLLIILAGGIDLSVGSVVALVSVVTMQTYRLVYSGPEVVLPGWLVELLGELGLLWAGTGSMGWASAVAVPAGLLAGGLCGLGNGLAITRLGVVPFVVTLGTMSVARGLAVWLSGRQRVSFPLDARPGWVDALASSSSDVLFFDPGVWSLVLLAGLTAALLGLTVFGRHAYAMGSNEATARLCGVRVERHRTLTYALGGLFAGWAGILLFAHSNGGGPDAAAGLELEVIAAVVIGGASLSGGQGSVTGTLLGVLILGVLENGVSFFKVPIEVKYILIGVIVVVNTALSRWQRSRSV